MMRTASEKLAIIQLVEDSELSVRRTLDEIKVSRTSFYRWYAAYEKGGLDGLSNQGRVSKRHWNRILDAVRSLVIGIALDRPELTPDNWSGTSPIPTTTSCLNPVFIVF